MTDEIDNLSRYVDQQGREKLAAVRDLVVEKDRLDFARVHLGLTRGWLFVHVPVTYALIVLSLLHVLVVCLLCHTYHVNGVTTPIMSTRIMSTRSFHLFCGHSGLVAGERFASALTAFVIASKRRSAS